MFSCLFSSATTKTTKIFVLEFRKAIIKPTDAAAKKTSCKGFFPRLLQPFVFVLCVWECEREEKPIKSKLCFNACDEYLKVQIVIKSLVALPRKPRNILLASFSLALAVIQTRTQTSSFLFISRLSWFSPKIGRSFVFFSTFSTSRQSRKNFYRTRIGVVKLSFFCDLNGNRATELFSFLFVVIFSYIHSS